MSIATKPRELRRGEIYRVGEIVEGLEGEPMFVSDNTLERFVIIGTKVSSVERVPGLSCPHGNIPTEIYDFRKLYLRTRDLPLCLSMDDTFEKDPNFKKNEAFIQQHRGQAA